MPARVNLSDVGFAGEGAFVVLTTAEDADDGDGAGIFVDRMR